MTRTAIALALGAALTAPAAYAQQSQETIPPGDWPRYTRDLAGTHFSPLAQINTANVAKLVPAWSFKVRPEGGGVVVSSATPIVVDGVLYLPIGNAVVALQGDTGQEIWRHPETSGAVRRSVSYWPGDRDHPPRIFYCDGKSLIALDAKTGQPVAGFGDNGAVALDVPYNSAPTVFRNVLAIGANVQEMPIGEPGDSRAFDAVTGRKLWTFHTVPRPGEPGHETWLNDGWKGRSGTNVWVWYMTVDEKTGTLYMPVGGPSPNYDGSGRPGANLFGNSVVAVDAETGKLKWWFQTIHHDLWDSDLPAPPTLVDIRKDGRTVPALAATGKTGVRGAGETRGRRRCAGRVVLPDPADPGQARAPVAQGLDPGRHRDGAGHQRRACGRLPQAAAGLRRDLLQRRPLHTLLHARGRWPAEGLDQPADERRLPVGRHGGRSPHRHALHQHR